MCKNMTKFILYAYMYICIYMYKYIYTYYTYIYIFWGAILDSVMRDIRRLVLCQSRLQTTLKSLKIESKLPGYLKSQIKCASIEDSRPEARL